MSTDDLTALIAELAERIEAGLAGDEAAAQAASYGNWGELWGAAELHDAPHTGRRVVLSSIIIVADVASEAVGDHVARNDPGRRLRDVKATRNLVAEILAEQHYTTEVEYYSCSQAREGQYLIGGPTGPPGSGCSDPERSGKPCDCGRDEKVARLLGIIASEWEG